MTMKKMWKTLGKHGIVPLILFITSSASVCAETCAEVQSCQVNVTEIGDIQKQFEESVSSWGVLGVNFWIKGVEWEESENTTGVRIFDPNWWNWYTEEAGSLLEMPIDYDILSVGFLALRVSNLDLQFESSPPGCLSALPDSCKQKIIQEFLLNITKREKDSEDDMICQSFIQQHSVITGNTVGAGKRCCKRDSFKNDSDFCNSKASTYESKYGPVRVFVFVFGTILPLLGIPLVAAWADFQPLSVGLGFADYASNKLAKYCHFRLRGISGCTALEAKTVIIPEKELIDFEGPVLTISSLARKELPVQGGKLKCTIVFLLQYIPVGLWVYYYGTRRDTFKYFRTAEEVVFNLRYNPFAWLHTDSNLWPYKVAVFLIFLNVLAFLSMTAWWLLEIPTLRKALMDLVLKSNMYGKYRRGQFRSRRTSIPLEKIFRRIFIVNCTTVIVGIYMVVFSMFHSAIYTLGGIVVNIELLASYITGVGLVIYYVNKSYTGVKAKYTEIKRLVLEECMEQRVYKGTHVVTCDILINDAEHCRMVDRDKQEFKYEKISAEGPVIFYSKEKNFMVPKRMFLHICEQLEPLGANLKRAVIDFLFTFFFAGLVVFTIAVFRPYNATSEMSVVVTSIVTLLTALLPSIVEMSTCQEQVELEKSVLRFKVKKAVGVYQPRFRTLVTTRPLKYGATILRKVARDDLDAVNPETMAPMGTMVIGKQDSGSETANEFHSPSSLPTPLGTMKGILAPSAPGPLPTIPSGLALNDPPSGETGNLPRRPSSASLDSGMMVLNISDLNLANKHDEDDIKFADDSGGSKEHMPLVRESPV